VRCLFKRDGSECEVNAPQHFPNLPNQCTHGEGRIHLRVTAIKQTVVVSFQDANERFREGAAGSEIGTYE
jgi:hypothetical protein